MSTTPALKFKKGKDISFLADKRDMLIKIQELENYFKNALEEVGLENEIKLSADCLYEIND